MLVCPTPTKADPAPLCGPRRQLLVVLASGLGAVLTGCDAWSTPPLAVAAHPWVGYAPMFMARDLGWLDAQRVHLVQTANATQSIGALAAGQVQAAALTLDEALTARDQGLDLSLVLVFNESVGADMLLGHAGLTRLSDLRAKRLGYEASSVAEIMLAAVLKAAGLPRSEVSLVNLPVDQQEAAWRAGQVDAVVTYEPVASSLLALGAQRLFDSRAIAHTIVDVLAVRTEVLQDARAQALRHLLLAHFRALRRFTLNPQDAAYRMAAFLQLPASRVLSAAKGLVLPSLLNNQTLLAAQPPQLLPIAQRVQTLLFDLGRVRLRTLPAGLLQGAFLPPEAALESA